MIKCRATVVGSFKRDKPKNQPLYLCGTRRVDWHLVLLLHPSHLGGSVHKKGKLKDFLVENNFSIRLESYIHLCYKKSCCVFYFSRKLSTCLCFSCTVPPVRPLSVETNVLLLLQAGQLAELRRRVSMLEETVRELESQQCHGIFIWRLKGFSVHLRNQDAGVPVVEHSPGFYTGRPGYKLCLRLHLQTPNAPRCSNYISLFVHTMQGAFDGQLTWPFQGTIRLAILDQGPEAQHHMEVMETKPDLQAFQKPTIQRNPKGFGYVTFLHLHQLSQRAFVKDDTLLIRCEVTPRFDNMIHREGPAVQPRGPEASVSRD